MEGCLACSPSVPREGEKVFKSLQRGREKARCPTFKGKEGGGGFFLREQGNLIFFFC